MCSALDVPDDSEFACDTLGLRLDGLRDKTLNIFDHTFYPCQPKTWPQLLSIKTKKLDSASVILSAPGKDDIELDLTDMPRVGIRIGTHVFARNVKGVICGYMHDRWISGLLLDRYSGMHLMYYYRVDTPEQINENFVRDTRAADVILNDNECYTLNSLSSIGYINKNLPHPLDRSLFRSNFYVKMDKDEPLSENKWKWIKIGNDTIFKVVGLNPYDHSIDSYVKGDPDLRPSNILKRSRKWGRREHPRATIGLKLKVHTLGNVKRGDVIYIGK